MKAQGFKIAIDDLGSGYSGLKLWAELQPDYVKIDRHFIRDIQEDLVKREFVRSVSQLCESLDCKLIAEGVESKSEFTLVRELGIRYLQGFFLGRPKALPMASLDLLGTFPQSGSDNRTGSAAAMGRPVEPIAPTETLGVALERLQRTPGLFSLPVVENGRPLGLLHKWRVLELFSGLYGWALYEKLSVRKKMSTDALVVEHDCPLDEVSRLLTQNDDHYLKQHFIIVRNGHYEGLGSTRALLKRVTENRIEKARYANPLTQLPGNVPIQKELEERLAGTEPFVLIYFDINHFKPLNDTLGYARGDSVIVKLGQLLQEHFSTSKSLIGHIGGDDFIVITGHEDVLRECATIQNRFLTHAMAAYSREVQGRGYVESVDRNGQNATFPLVSLAAGIVSVQTPHTHTSGYLSEIAARAKHVAKSRPDGLYVAELESNVLSSIEATG